MQKRQHQYLYIIDKNQIIKTQAFIVYIGAVQVGRSKQV